MSCIWLQGRLEVFLKELESERQLKIDEVITYITCSTHVVVPDMTFTHVYSVSQLEKLE